MPLSTAFHIPTATYRFQLHKEFPFATLQTLIPYLDELGISDCYLSPITRAIAGSQHGYDVSDPTMLNPELGGEEGFRALAAALRERGMGCLVDFVPNHMGIAGPSNRWWQDVLENGQQSPYAHYFDIEWHPRHEALHDRVLVPVLGGYYGQVLEAGELQLGHAEGRFFIAYGEARFPLRPESVRLLQAAGDPEEVLRAYNGRVGDPASFDRLHALLDEQHYRLAFWKTGAHETNYRRFFAIDTLVGLRVEEADVMRATHSLLALLVKEGLVRGVRLDHIDGLWNPTRYLEDFQALCAPAGGPPLYTLVEKILAEGETLPAAWPLHGATGYEFIPQLAGLFIDPTCAAGITETYAHFTGLSATAADTIYAKKRLVLEELFPNSIGNLGLGLDHIVEYDRRWRDLTLHELRVAVRETMACLSVYRTYRQPGLPAGPADEQVLRAACDEAKRRNRGLDPLPFEFVCEVLRGAYHEDPLAEHHQETADDWTMKFQQATGAVMAKSVEDTAFYVYTRFFALNEVGGDIGRLGAGGIEPFHAANAQRLAETPQAMLTTSTHDTKVSEDVRARLYALSEQPEAWRQNLETWAAHNRRFKTEVDGLLAPDANEEYLLYQVLLGAWPLGAEEADSIFIERMKDYLTKAISEAKINTNWSYPNKPWLAAATGFVEQILDPSSRFLPLFLPQARALAVHGMVNSLAQLVLKLTVPGMPDLYQGNEIWDFSLVDPDNRRPVDFAQRQALLDGLAQRTPEDLLQNWRDGGIKLHLTRTLLRLRRQFPDLFQKGDYTPLHAEGPYAENVVAFSRSGEGKTLYVAVPRLAGKIGLPPLGEKWAETCLKGHPLKGRELLTQRDLAGNRLSEWFATLPCAVMLV